jgi:type II secretory ATPase GspE/PulE/Tfp pilus assembly ATPase PilB-like protein
LKKTTVSRAADTPADSHLGALVNAILLQAVRARASDIHFEPFERELKIRYRVDGALYEMPPQSSQLVRAIGTRLKVLAHLDIAETRTPQDGRLSFCADGREIDLRLATLPTQWGESLVLRVLDQSTMALRLEALGWPETAHQILTEQLQRPHGILIVTGPTGSGKTTTLYSCLEHLRAPERKVVTVEDPVEYELAGVTQVQIQENIGLGFPEALRSLLRHDPDVLMIGEMRDEATAQIAVQAALTGHLVLTTLHTQDTTGALVRLLDLGIEPFLLSATVNCVISQRLVRRLCPQCRRTMAPTIPQEFAAIAAPQDAIHQASGCEQCAQTGYRGRLPIVEALPMTQEFHSLLQTRATASVLREQALRQGLIPLRADGWSRIAAGETTIEEVLAACC